MSLRKYCDDCNRELIDEPHVIVRLEVPLAAIVSGKKPRTRV